MSYNTSTATQRRGVCSPSIHNTQLNVSTRQCTSSWLASLRHQSAAPMHLHSSKKKKRNPETTTNVPRPVIPATPSGCTTLLMERHVRVFDDVCGREVDMLMSVGTALFRSLRQTLRSRLCTLESAHLDAARQVRPAGRPAGTCFVSSSSSSSFQNNNATNAKGSFDATLRRGGTAVCSKGRYVPPRPFSPTLVEDHMRTFEALCQEDIDVVVDCMREMHRSMRTRLMERLWHLESQRLFRESRDVADRVSYVTSASLSDDELRHRRQEEEIRVLRGILGDMMVQQRQLVAMVVPLAEKLSALAPK
eukprot:PhM_4_TR18286/c0_g1_i1/m.28482